MVDLIAPLRFAAGGVSSKATTPELCHFLIEGGRVSGYDGVLTMSAPIEIGFSLKPRAAEMLNSIKACPEDAAIALSKTPAGKLSIKSGKFKGFVNCLPDDYALLVPQPEGDIYPVGAHFLPAIQAVIPFCADGKGPLWSQGVRIGAQAAYATNSIVLVAKAHMCAFPFDFIIPVAAAKELFKLKDAVTHLQICKTSVTFHFGDKWLRTVLIDGKWPDNVAPMFAMPGDKLPLPDGFFDNIKTLASVPVADEATPKVYFREGVMSTSPSDDTGSAIDMHVANAGIYPLEQLLLLEGTATHIAWGNYPKPCTFSDGIDGQATIFGILLGFQR